MEYAPVLGQMLVITGLVMCNFSDGFIFGQLSGMVDALHANYSSIRLDDDDISWIASTINVTCFCGFAVMTVITEVYGRRKSITIITIPLIISWIMVYYAQDKFTLLASRIIVGTCYGGFILLSYVNIGEYIPPNVRSLVLNMTISVGSSAGTMCGHILGIFLHWRTVALIGIIPTAISALIPIFWTESPSWLAFKGKFEECQKAFKSLRVESEDSEMELKMLMEFEKAKQKSTTRSNTFYKFLAATKHKYFWKIAFLIYVIAIYRTAGAKILFNTFAITMIQDITGSSDIFYYTFLIDGFAILGGCISCILVNRFKMRNLLFTSGILSNIVLLITAVCLYVLNSNSPYIVWLKVSLLALYFVSVTAGPYAVLETILSEVHPLDIKSANILHVGCIAGIMQFLAIKLASTMFLSIGYHGVFLLNAIIIFLCLLYLYIYLPETKGRTLQEIEYYFKYNTFEYTRDLEEKENIVNKTGAGI